MSAARASYPCAPSRACSGDILHDRLRGLRCRARSHYVDRILGFSNEKREVRELRLKGKISNFMSMEAKDFMIIFFPPQPDSVRVDVSYNLISTRDICINQTNGVAAVTLHVVSMAAYYRSPRCPRE